MKKGLLIGLFGIMTAMSASAWEANDYVYTNEGRYQITDPTNLAKGKISQFEGWTAVSATAGTELSALFTVEEDTIQSLTNALGEGMSYSFTSADPFVISFKICGTASSAGVPLAVTRSSYGCTNSTVNSNVIKIVGVTEDGSAETILNSGVTLPEGWATWSFGFNPSTTTYASYKIYMTGLNTSLRICDFAIQAAQQVADLRKRDALLKYADAFATANPKIKTDDFNETYEAVAAITDASTQEDLDGAITGLKEVLVGNETEKGLIKPNFDDQLVKDQSRFGIWASKVQKSATWGEWTCYPDGRGYCTANAYPRVGDYAGYAYWGYDGTGATPHGISMNISLQPGKYVFVTNAKDVAREYKSSKCWDENMALDYGYGYMYVCKEGTEDVGGVATTVYKDTVKTTGNYDLPPYDYTQGVLQFDITEAGTYQVGLKSFVYSNNLAAMLGGNIYIKDVEFYGKTNALYSKTQEAYYANVMTQINTGFSALETAKGYVKNADYKWGKADLQACIDSVAPKMAVYADTTETGAYSKAKIIATMPESYTSGVKDTLTSGLEAKVYLTAVQYILAGNKSFVAKNDTLTSLATAIAKAENTLGMRIYSAATGRADFQAEIDKAKNLQTALLLADYSRENAAAIVTENAALVTAANTFAASVPASAITDIVDIDFEKAAVCDDPTAAATETGSAATIAGNKGTMAFTFFTTVSPTTATVIPFEQGIDNNAEKVLPGVLRVGNGDGTVNDIDFGETGSNIYKVSMDWWLLRLSGKYTGFYLNNVDEAGVATKVAGLYFNPYEQATGSLWDPCGIQNGQAYFVANTTGNDGSCTDANKTHMELILDYGTKTMYMTTTTPAGSYTSSEVEFDSTLKINQFVVTSNYANFKDRRNWFDNLKIQKIAAEPLAPITGDEDGNRKVNVLDVNKAISKIVAGQTPTYTLDTIISVICGAAK